MYNDDYMNNFGSSGETPPEDNSTDTGEQQSAPLEPIRSIPHRMSPGRTAVLRLRITISPGRTATLSPRIILAAILSRSPRKRRKR